LGVQSLREIISGGTRTKKVEYHCSKEHCVCHKIENTAGPEAQIEIASAVIPPATTQEVCRSLQRSCKQCINAGGGHFEN
jgi:hypothetical protein